MQKSVSQKVLFAVIFLVLGTVLSAFVFSQGAGSGSTVGLAMSFTQPSGGAWHPSEEVYCNGCIHSPNLAGDVVTSIKILDGEILDQDISFGAAIKKDKLQFYGGHFVQGVVFGGSNTAIIPGSGSWGVSSWTGKRLNIICDIGPSNDGDVFVYAGVTDHFSTTAYEKIYNHYITTLFPSTSGVGTAVNIGDPAYGWTKIYDASRRTVAVTPTVTATRFLYARPNPSTPSEIQLGQIVTGTTLPFTSPWVCLVDYN